MASVIKVKVEGRLHTVECGAGSATACSTYGQLRAVLQRQGHLTPDHVLVDADDRALRDADAIDLTGDTTVFVKWLSFDITVVDEHVSAVLQVSTHRSVRQVRDAFEEETSRAVPVLSFGGTRLEDDATLLDYGIAQGAMLVGRVKVTVQDLKCDLSTFVSMFDFQSASELKQAYADAARRHIGDGATLSFRGDILSDETSLYHAGIRDRSTVEFENPPFEVVLVDEDDEGAGETTLVVADYFTGAMVKEAYAKETRQALVPDDRIAFGDDTLDDAEMIFSAGVGTGAHLTLHREDQSRATDYECGGCGGIVKLKRSEPTRCRSCGYRIVYKLRSTRPSQYIAR